MEGLRYDQAYDDDDGWVLDRMPSVRRRVDHPWHKWTDGRTRVIDIHSLKTRRARTARGLRSTIYGYGRDNGYAVTAHLGRPVDPEADVVLYEKPDRYVTFKLERIET